MTETTEGGQVWLWAIISIVISAGLGYLFFYSNSGLSNDGLKNDENTVASTTSRAIQQENKNTMILHTNFGDITVELSRDKTPNTAENFEELAKAGFYNGTRFHRVIKNFMIQGGDPQSKDVALKAMWGTGGPGYQFADEIAPDNNNLRGTISMANAGPNTNGSQFFINTVDNIGLNPKHTVFGKVTAGMDVVDKIESVQTGERDVPVTDVIIESVEIK